MKKTLIAILILSLFCAGLLFVPANATETDEIIDWNTVDWETFDFSYLWNGEFASQRLESWNHWMLNEASLERLVEVAKGRPDASFATDYAFALGRRFVQEPFGMLTAMTQCDSDMQDDIAGYLAFSEAYGAEKVDIVKFLTDLQLPEGASAERAMLNKIIDYVEQYYGVEIPRNEAPEIIDWNTVDWDTFNLLEYCRNDDGGDDWARIDSWYTWMENEATLDQLMEVVKAKMGAYQSPLYADALVCRFIKEPLAMLTAIAQADEAYQDRFIQDLTPFYGDEVDLIKTLAEVKLPADASAEREILNKIIDRAKQLNGVEIPRTGDPIALTLAALLLSGTGLAVVVSKKKKIA